MNVVRPQDEPHTILRTVNLAELLKEAKALCQDTLMYCHRTHRVMGISTPCHYHSRCDGDKHLHTIIPDDEELALIVLTDCLKWDGNHYYHFHRSHESIKLDYFTF